MTDVRLDPKEFLEARLKVLTAAARLLDGLYPGLAADVRNARDELDRADRTHPGVRRQSP